MLLFLNIQYTARYMDEMELARSHFGKFFERHLYRHVCPRSHSTKHMLCIIISSRARWRCSLGSLPSPFFTSHFVPLFARFAALRFVISMNEVVEEEEEGSDDKRGRRGRLLWFPHMLRRCAHSKVRKGKPQPPTTFAPLVIIIIIIIICARALGIVLRRMCPLLIGMWTVCIWWGTDMAEMKIPSSLGPTSSCVVPASSGQESSLFSIFCSGYEN